MQGVTTFLMFPRDGARAIELYTSVFEDARIDNMVVDPSSGALLQASFTLGCQRFHAMDGGEYFSFAQGMSLHIACEDQAEVDYYWEKLTADGGAPGRCGWLTDPFGISWQVVPNCLGELLGGADSAGAQRAAQAMMGMSKMVVSELEAAYAGTSGEPLVAG